MSEYSTRPIRDGVKLLVECVAEMDKWVRLRLPPEYNNQEISVRKGLVRIFEEEQSDPNPRGWTCSLDPDDNSGQSAQVLVQIPRWVINRRASSPKFKQYPNKKGAKHLYRGKYRFVHRTAHAVLLRTPDGDQLWVPQKVIDTENGGVIETFIKKKLDEMHRTISRQPIEASRVNPGRVAGAPGPLPRATPSDNCSAGSRSTIPVDHVNRMR